MELVRDARKGDGATDATKGRAIAVLEALIKADATELEHRYHSELGYIELDLGHLDEAVNALTKAIDIRNRRGKSGWKYYEYRRAIARIRQAKKAGSASPELRKLIRADVASALSDPKYKDRFQENRDIKEWQEAEVTLDGPEQTT